MATLKLCGIAVLALFLAGCAGHFPVPGGSDTVNSSFYESEDDLKGRIQALNVGMPKAEVFAKLDRKEEHFILLSRNEITSTLYGGVQPQYMPQYSYASYGYGNNYGNRYNYGGNNYGSGGYQSGLQSFTGYKLIFKNVEREHGISSPIAMRTDEVGFSYVATFIFQNGRLYEKPILSGGVVDARSTKTIFDYLSPETVMGRVPI